LSEASERKTTIFRSSKKLLRKRLEDAVGLTFESASVRQVAVRYD